MPKPGLHHRATLQDQTAGLTALRAPARTALASQQPLVVPEAPPAAQIPLQSPLLFLSLLQSPVKMLPCSLPPSLPLVTAALLLPRMSPRLPPPLPPWSDLGSVSHRLCELLWEPRVS